MASLGACDVMTAPLLAILRFMRDDRGLLEALLSDGRFLLSITGLILALSGGFAIFQSLTGYFLPQDVHALGFDARQLAADRKSTRLNSSHLGISYAVFCL